MSGQLNNYSKSFLSDDQAVYSYSQMTELFYPLISMIVFAIGFLGNGALIGILLKSSQTSSSIYTMSLAFSDIALCVFPFTFTLYFKFTDNEFDQLACKITDTIFDMSVNITALTLTSMSIDRWAAVSSAVTWMRRQSDKRLKNYSYITVFAIWLISIIASLPSAYYSNIIELRAQHNKTLIVCAPYSIDKLQPLYPQIIILAKFLITYLFPLIIMSCCYTSIACQLMVRSRMSSRQVGREKARKKAMFTAKIVFILIILFMVCFLPHHIYEFWFYFQPNEVIWNFWYYFRAAAFLLTAINSMLNPVTLYLTSGQIKKEFNRYFCYCYNFGNVATVKSNLFFNKFWSSQEERVKIQQHIDHQRRQSLKVFDDASKNNFDGHFGNF